MSAPSASLDDLNVRSREIFARLVETFLATGEPVGSRTLSRALGAGEVPGLSAASIRNVMQDLEHLGLLDSPHVSAGRVPTEAGLRLFVDGVLEIGDVPEEERRRIEAAVGGVEGDMPKLLDEAGSMLSGLTRSASLVFAPKSEAPVRHVEFVPLAPDRALAILVTEDGNVENRVFSPPPGLTPSDMTAAANFLNARLIGRTLADAQAEVERQIAEHRSALDSLAASLVERGLALWASAGDRSPERLIVRGRANLIAEGQGAEDVERMRRLFDDLEKKRDLAQLLDLAEEAAGIRVFIGSENKLFSLSGSSLVIAPYTDANRRIIGAIGVIGPTRLNYGRIVPIVDFTARMVGRMVSGTGAADAQRTTTRTNA